MVFEFSAAPQYSGFKNNFKGSLSAFFVVTKSIAFKCSLDLHFLCLDYSILQICLGTVQNSSQLYRCPPYRFTFTFYDLRINFFCISEFCFDPTHNLNYKGKRNSEKIQRVKMIRLNLNVNNISLSIGSNLLHFNFTKSNVRKPQKQ